MKRILLLILILPLISFGKERILHMSMFEKKSGLVYIKGEAKPYTGHFFSNHDNNKIKYDKKQLEVFGKIVNGQPDGVITEYYKDGKKSKEENYKEGELHGIKTLYFSNGKIAFEDYYANGEREGISKAYHENGNLWIEGYYSNGDYNGEVKIYDENGKLEKVELYKNGFRINK